MPNDKITPIFCALVGLWKKHRCFGTTTSTRPSTTAEKSIARGASQRRAKTNAGGGGHAPAGDTKTKEISSNFYLFFFSWVQIPL